MSAYLDVEDTQLEGYEHLNRAQKRAFILRDQLKYMEPQHLDALIEGMHNPEPPSYKRTSDGVQPPFEQVRINDCATRFDLGNIEFNDRSIRRVHLVYSEGSYELQESEAMPQDDKNLFSMPMRALLTKDMIPMFKAKNEALHERVQSLNETRKFVYEQARNKPAKTQKQFKEGKSLAKLLDSAKDDGATAAGESRKRRGELVHRHPLNKKKRIGLEYVTTDMKTEVVNRLPEQAKIDLFNAFAKAALPNLDSLLMAAWNVVSVYVNVGSQDTTLHESIGDLHEVLMEFEQYVGKPKKAQRPDFHGNAGSQTDIRNGSLGKAPAAQAFGTLDGGSDVSGDRHVDRLVELPPNSREGTDRQTPVRRPDASDQSTTKQLASSVRPDGRSLPQTHADLFSHTSAKKNKLRGHNDPLLGLVSGIDEGYKATQQQHTPSTAQSLDKPSTKPKSLNPADNSPLHLKPAELAAAAADRRKQQQEQSQRYGMFNGNNSPQDSLGGLFMNSDDDDEAVETPAMQEVHEQEEKEVVRKPGMGNFMLGAPKKPSIATGAAPVAPMMHNSPKGDAERRGR